VGRETVPNIDWGGGTAVGLPARGTPILHAFYLDNVIQKVAKFLVLEDNWEAGKFL
jgi:hypothetical protein